MKGRKHRGIERKTDRAKCDDKLYQTSATATESISRATKSCAGPCETMSARPNCLACHAKRMSEWVGGWVAEVLRVKSCMRAGCDSVRWRVEGGGRRVATQNQEAHTQRCVVERMEYRPKTTPCLCCYDFCCCW